MTKQEELNRVCREKTELEDKNAKLERTVKTLNGLLQDAQNSVRDLEKRLEPLKKEAEKVETDDRIVAVFRRALRITDAIDPGRDPAIRAEAFKLAAMLLVPYGPHSLR